MKAGRLNRFYAQYERARHWFEAAADVSRIQEKRSAQAIALLSWGNLDFQRGSFVGARRRFNPSIAQRRGSATPPYNRHGQPALHQQAHGGRSGR